MKKNMLVFILLLFFVSMPTRVKAIVRANQITSRNECPKLELAVLRSDGLDKVECYENYDQAKAAMDNDSREDLAIIENGMVIDAKYAVIDYDTDRKNTINVYNTSTSSSTNGHYILSTAPDDAIVLGYDYNTKRIQIKVSGMTGWIDKYRGNNIIYDVVPLAWIKDTQYYQVTSDRIIHVFPGNVYGTNESEGSSIAIDSKPSMLNPGKYYSYDGHYFYNDLKTMIRDYKANTYVNSVNPTKPYYNFYQYMSFRSKTTYNADNINSYLNDRTSASSVLHPSSSFNPGEVFIKYQNQYGTNAILMLSIATNESSWGNYLIARNNIFGLNAVDSNPSGNADGFDSIEDCIRQFSYYWLSFGFLQPGDNGGGITKTRFRGSNVGNKEEGLNYKYASDPFWGEKAAAYYYQLDKHFDFQEKKQFKYEIAVLNNTYTDGIYAKKIPNGENVSNFYKYVHTDSPIVIVGEEKDSNGEIWYKIQSDATLDANGNFINNSSDNGGNNKYLWDANYVYVSSKYFRKVSEEVTEYPSNNPQNNENNNGGITPSVDSVSTIITKARYRKEGNLISGISLNTESSTLINALTGKGATNVSVTNANGEPKSGRLATGDKVTLTGATTETLIIVINGDLTGDGEINSADLLRMRQHLLGNGLSGAYERAAYMGYSEINSANLLRIRQYLLGQVGI